jgi:hypothetical protein
MGMSELILMLQREINQILSVEVYPIEDINLSPDGAAPPFVLLKDGPIETIQYKQKSRDENMEVTILVVAPYYEPGSGLMGTDTRPGVLDMADTIKNDLQNRIIDGFTFVSISQDAPSVLGALSSVEEGGDPQLVDTKALSMKWQGCS